MSNHPKEVKIPRHLLAVGISSFPLDCAHSNKSLPALSLQKMVFHVLKSTFNTGTHLEPRERQPECSASAPFLPGRPVSVMKTVHLQIPCGRPCCSAPSKHSLIAAAAQPSTRLGAALCADEEFAHKGKNVGEKDSKKQ